MDSRNDKPYYNSSVRSFPRPQVRPCRQFHVRQCFLESRDAQLRGTVQQITLTYHHPGRNAWCNSADQCPLVPPPFPATPPFPPMYTEPSRVAFDEPPLAQSAHQKPAALAGAASSKCTARRTTIAAAAAIVQIEKETGRDARLHTQARPGQSGEQHPAVLHTGAFSRTGATSALRGKTEKSAGSAKGEEERGGDERGGMRVEEKLSTDNDDDRSLFSTGCSSR